MSGLGRWATGGAVFAGSLVLGVQPAVASSSDVVIVGDSLLGSAADELGPKLSNLGWTPHIVAVDGSGLTAETTLRTGQEWRSSLATLEEQHDPAVVVIELGTNDARYVRGGEPYGPLIDSLLATTDAPTVLWADCSTHAFSDEHNEGCRTINGELYAREPERTGFGVLPYDEQVAARPGNTAFDTIHLNAAGQDALAQLIADGVGPLPK